VRRNPIVSGAPAFNAMAAFFNRSASSSLKEVFYYLKKAAKESRVNSGCKCRNVVRICVQ
jgi:hypothetical protein